MMHLHYLDILAKSIKINWDKPAVVELGLDVGNQQLDMMKNRKCTYGQLYCAIRYIIRLFVELSIDGGEHIAICGSNSCNWIIAFLSVVAHKAVAVTIGHTQPTKDIAEQVDFSDSTVLFIEKDIWSELQAHNLSKVKYVISIEDFEVIYSNTATAVKQYNKEDWHSLFNNNCLSKPKDISFSHTEAGDMAMICFTSGTTESPKGVMLSHRSISNVIAGFGRFNVFDKFNAAKVLSLLPLSHIYGLVIETLVPLCSGCSISIPNQLALRNIIKVIEEVQPQIMFLVPAMLQQILDNLTFIKPTLQKMEFIVVAGAMLTPELEAILISNHIPLATGYGLTETCSCCCWQWNTFYKPNSVGKIVPGIEIKFTDEHEILLRGENIMLGYYKNLDLTSTILDETGWLHTGDCGWMDDDGFVYVTRRLTQNMVVLPNGENIYVEEIENKINALQQVRESIVINRNDKLIALIYKAAEITKQDILNTINPQLPLYSQLADIEFIDSPLQRTGKQNIKRYLYN